MQDKVHTDPITTQQAGALWLSHTDLFRDVPRISWEAVAPRLQHLLHEEGVTLIRKDDWGDTMYVIIKGRVKVHDEDLVVATLGSGEYFGEMALLHAAPRSMSVTALEPVELIGIDQLAFYELVHHHPDSLRHVISQLVIRLRQQNHKLISAYQSREAELKQQVEEQTRLYKEQKEKAEQSEQFKQQFLANMSHEIRTPMHAVMGMTHLLLEKQPRADQLEYLQGIRHAGQILLHIINDILDLSKIEAGKMELEAIDFSLSEWLKGLEQSMQIKAREKNLQFVLEQDPELFPFIQGDPVRLNQVLTNLCGNAIKFTDQGEVRLIIQQLSQTADTQTIRFAVKDTGIGIPADKLESVFEGFSQANISDTRKYGGTGLGLTISRQLIEQMGGVIQVESQVYQPHTHAPHGTTFSFELSFTKGIMTNARSEDTIPDRHHHLFPNGSKVLVVDDNPFNRLVARDILESKTELQVFIVEGGQEAVDFVKEQRVDLILMDLQMPEVDGYTATRLIRQLPGQLANIPIIALTASVLKQDIERCYEAGMNGYLTKPFTPDELLEAVVNQLIQDNTTEEASNQPPASKVSVKSDPSIFNATYLQKFCEQDKQRMQRYAEMILKILPPWRHQVQKAIEEADKESVAVQLHTVRTQLMMMGMDLERQQALALEHQCRQAEWATDLYRELEHFLQRIQEGEAQLYTWLQKLSDH